MMQGRKDHARDKGLCKGRTDDAREDGRKEDARGGQMMKGRKDDEREK